MSKSVEDNPLSYFKNKYNNLFKICCSKIGELFTKEQSTLIIDKLIINDNFFRYIDYIMRTLFSYKTRVESSRDYVINDHIIAFCTLLYIECLASSSNKFNRFMDNFMDSIYFDRDLRKYMMRINIKELIYPIGLCRDQVELSNLYEDKIFDFLTLPYSYSRDRVQSNSYIASPPSQPYVDRGSSRDSRTNTFIPVPPSTPPPSQSYVDRGSSRDNRTDIVRPPPIQTDFDNQSPQHTFKRMSENMEDRREYSESGMKRTRTMSYHESPRYEYSQLDRTQHQNNVDEFNRMRDQIRYLENELFSRDDYIKRLLKDREELVDKLKQKDSYIYSMSQYRR